METKADIASSLYYSGEVSVSVMRGSKLIKKIKQHNEGGEWLFKFFAECLVGRYSTSTDYRPKQLLLTNGAAAASTFIGFNQTPTYEAANDSGVGVTFHFTVPYAYLSGTSIDTLYLYCDEYANDAELINQQNWSAKCELGDNAIVVSRETNIILIIDWTLHIKESGSN